jgi:hypothetical protein
VAVRPHLKSLVGVGDRELPANEAHERRARGGTRFRTPRVRAADANGLPALEHQWEIAREFGYRDFADAERELAGWVDDVAWTTGLGPNAIFVDAIRWLRDRRVLLPGVSVLARIVAREREQGLDRIRSAGLSARRERDLVNALSSHPGT